MPARFPISGTPWMEAERLLGRLSTTCGCRALEGSGFLWGSGLRVVL